MTKEQIETRMKEREEFIVSILKEDPKSTVTGKSIDDAVGITASNRVMYMKKLMKKYPQIQNIGTKEAEYKWVEDAAPVPKKNKEGYHDPTAEKAINGIDAPVKIPEIGTDLAPRRNTSNEVVNHKGYSDPYTFRKNPEPVPGEIWSATESNGKDARILVVNVTNDSAQCIKLFPAGEYIYDVPEDTKISLVIEKGNYIGDVGHLTFKPLKYLIRRSKKPDEELLSKVRSCVIRILSIEPETVYKEVPVEVKIDPNPELEAENHDLKAKILQLQNMIYELENKEEESSPIQNGYVDCKTAEIAILTEQRDIWKTVALKLLEKGGW